jgi:hypothetical protein
MDMRRLMRQACFVALLAFSATAYAGQAEPIKLTVGYSPISAATLPFFIAVEERLFQKHGLEVVPVFFGGSPLINAAMMAGQFLIGLTGRPQKTHRDPAVTRLLQPGFRRHDGRVGIKSIFGVRRSKPDLKASVLSF